jgi:type II secretory ATPase GspE/PulE/Tfp pilus assembly ATPase PilB-like protein
LAQPPQPPPAETAERLRLGERLVRDGHITPHELRTALQEQEKTHEPLGAVLVRMGFLPAETLAAVRAADLGIAFVQLAGVTPDPELLAAITPDFARRHACFPLRREKHEVVVALARPVDILCIDAIKQRLWRHIKVVAATQRDIDAAIRRHLESHDADIDAAARGAAEQPQEDATALTDRILEQGLRWSSTDIHVEPEESLTRVRYRIDGGLEQGESLTPQDGAGVLARIKIMSGLDITERRKPQDGRISLARPNGAKVDLRVSIMPTCHGENAVLRVLDRSSVSLGLAELGIEPRDQEVLAAVGQRSHGMLLVSGPTGSGKTTTLYSILLSLDSLTRKIITIEDPVEYQLPLIRQSQIDVAAGYHFADGLRASLRQDPDVILVGEIRDQETANTALKASLTGHLVLSSIHTNSAAGVITRLLDLGVDRYLLVSSLTAAMAQRLVRKVCGQCAAERPSTAAEAALLRVPEGTPLREGTGCRTCRGTGCAGRLVVYEILQLDAGAQAVLAGGGGERELLEHALAHGFRSIADNARARVLAGSTTVRELLRVCPAEHLGPQGA